MKPFAGLDRRERSPRAAISNSASYLRFIHLVIDKGWPKEDDKLRDWMERMTTAPWVEQIQQAVLLEPGLIQDPGSYFKNALPPDHSGRFLPDAGRVLVARALYRARQKQAKEALDDLETAFSLARHLWHTIAPRDYLMSEGLHVQAAALAGLDHWTREAQPGRALLQRAFEIVCRQDQTQPTSQLLRQAGVYASQNNPPRHPLVSACLRVPWEQERWRRLLRERAAASESDYGDRRYGALQTWIEDDLHTREKARAAWRAPLRGMQLQLALMLYEFDQGKVADNLDQLAPRYLSILPLNPVDDSPFAYHVYRGDKTKQAAGNIKVSPGQGVIMTTSRQDSFFIIVPRLTNKK
jgi:hypothetical protein